MRLAIKYHPELSSRCLRSRLLSVVVIFVVLSSVNAFAQDVTSSSVSCGVLVTEAEKTAVRLLVEQTKALGDLYVADENYIFDISPDIRIETGSEDAFDGIIAKLTGNMIFFRTTETLGGVQIPDARFFLVLPVSAGFETNRDFDNVNLIAEAGFVPWYWNPTVLNVPWHIKQTKAAIFVQGGYKFGISDSTNVNLSGGSKDENEEEPDSGLFRLKASAKFSPKYMLSESVGISPIGASDFWYDIVNSDIYYRLEATFKVILPYDLSFDFSYEKGSGAPNFNQGDQFSANLTIGF